MDRTATISTKPTKGPLARVAKMEPAIRDNSSIPVMKNFNSGFDTKPQSFEQEQHDLSNAVKIAGIILDLEAKKIEGNILNRADLQKFFVAIQRRVMELKHKEDDRMEKACRSRNGRDISKEEKRLKHVAKTLIVFYHDVNLAIAKTVEDFDRIKAKFDKDKCQQTFTSDVQKLIRRYCGDLKDAIYPDCEIFDEIVSYNYEYHVHHQPNEVNRHHLYTTENNRTRNRRNMYSPPPEHYRPENFDEIGTFASTADQIEMRLKRQTDFLRKLLYKKNFSDCTELVRTVPMMMPYVMLIDGRRRKTGPIILPDGFPREDVGRYLQEHAPGYFFRLRD
ncbi:unnamed protein product [Caenorhabditis brenneri]